MRAESFNLGWKVKTGVAQPFDAIFAPGMPQGEEVVLPQDMMILEERDPACKSKAQSGFYPAKTYTYTKEFDAPEAWEDKTQLLEFEGVMSKALVYLNGNHIGTHRYGYSSLFVNLTPYLRYGEENQLKVVSANGELGSRWYPGSGIYRDVTLWHGGRAYIAPGALRVTTELIGADYAVIRIDYRITNPGQRILLLDAELAVIGDGEKTIAREQQCVHVEAGGDSEFSCRMTIENARLWSVDTPDLYELRLSLKADGCELDCCTESFGIRTIRLDAKRGLTLNGEEIKLRGACVHHDNGIIGATTVYAAEEFRIRKLKEAGFNSIRSAHNPASPALLRACDRLGMLVMDEFADMWNEQKNENDFAVDFSDTWRDEVSRMVAKDYNHPSVVLYSTGNEIPEIGRSAGALANQRIAAALRREDGTRFVTAGISGFLAVADRMGDYAEGQTGQEMPAEAKESSGGSEELNQMMGAAEQQMMDAFSVSQVLTDCIEPVEGQLDVIGYNYLTARHEYEHTLHPNRVIVGSETYPPEIPKLWRIVMRNPYVIGDFTWTGYDYLGEAGIGIYHYDSDRNEQGWYPDRLAYMGDIDINGNRRTISFLREIAYGIRKAPYLVVERVDKQGHTYDKNNWKYVDSIHSWTFPGYEGTKTRVHVLSGYEEVELFADGTSLGRKTIAEKDNYTAVYELVYAPGTLKAVAYENGQALACDVLETAQSPSELQITLSKERLCAGGADVCFVTIDLYDGAGHFSRFEPREVSVSVSGAGKLMGFGSADPSCEGSYQNTTAMTYDGRVMAAVRSGVLPGELTVTVSADGCGKRTLRLIVE